MTRDQIQAILRQEYNQPRWLQVLREIMPGTDVFAVPQVVPVNVSDAPSPVQIARVRLGDRKQLAVLEIKVSDRIDLLRNRVGLRNLVARFIDQAEYHGVLAVFLGPQKDYRFTFAAKISDLDQEGNLLSRETVPRRFTYLLWLHRQPSVTQPDRNHPQDPLIASYFEQTVNALVYELFFPQELHAAGLHFFELAASLPAPVSPPPATDERLDWFRKEFKKLSSPGHPLRVALDKLQTLDLVRIIEGHA